MATRLKRCIKRCIKIYIDKNDGDSDDEDFHGAVVMQTEKKWRPRRAATSRAIDTLRGAFDDDEFEVNIHIIINDLYIFPLIFICDNIYYLVTINKISLFFFVFFFDAIMTSLKSSHLD